MKKQNIAQWLLILMCSSFLITVINFLINLFIPPIWDLPIAKELPHVFYMLYWFEDGAPVHFLIIAIADLITILIGIILLKFKNWVFLPVVISYILDIIIVILIMLYQLFIFRFLHIVTIAVDVAIISLAILIIYQQIKGRLTKGKTD